MCSAWLVKFRTLSLGSDASGISAKCADSADSSIDSYSDALDTTAPAANGVIGTFGTPHPKFDDETRGTNTDECLAISAWRDLYEERATHRKFDDGNDRALAERLAWAELENRWHMLHGERVPTDICAGCRKPLVFSPVLDLIDGNRVHLADGHACLRQHGWRWREAATDGLIKLGLEKPAPRNRRKETDLPIINPIVGQTDAELTQDGSDQYREQREQRNGPEHRQ